jgi:hypothetical protein
MRNIMDVYHTDDHIIPWSLGYGTHHTDQYPPRAPPCTHQRSCGVLLPAAYLVLLIPLASTPLVVVLAVAIIAAIISLAPLSCGCGHGSRRLLLLRGSSPPQIGRCRSGASPPSPCTHMLQHQILVLTIAGLLTSSCLCAVEPASHAHGQHFIAPGSEKQTAKNDGKARTGEGAYPLTLLAATRRGGTALISASSPYKEEECEPYSKH